MDYGFCCEGNPHDSLVLRPADLVRAAAAAQGEPPAKIRARLRDVLRPWRFVSAAAARREACGDAADAEDEDEDEGELCVNRGIPAGMRFERAGGMPEGPAFQAGGDDARRYGHDGGSADPRRSGSVQPGAWREAVMVLALAAGVLLFGKDIVGEMLHRCKNIGWHTPEQSYSEEAAHGVDEYFPMHMRGAIVMAIEAVGSTPDVLTDAVADFSRNVSRSCAEDPRVTPYAPLVLGYYLDAGGYHPPEDLLRAEFVSADQRMTILVIQATKMSGNWNDANAFLQEYCGLAPPGYVLHITGIPEVLGGDGCFEGVHAKVNTRDMSFECIFRAEMCTLPVAMYIVGSIVKSGRLLVLPLVTVAVSFVVGALLTIPWMSSVKVPPDAVAAMGSVTLALCLDYSLFILSRFADQHREGMPLQQNIDLIRRYTNRTIAVSGSLVTIALFGSLLLPQGNLQGSGVALGWVTIACVATSTVLMPAMLLVFGHALVGSSGVPLRLGDHQLQGYVDHEETSDAVGPRAQGQEKSSWLSVARLVDRSPVAAMVAVLALTSPALLKFPEMNITGDAFAMMPMDMPALAALRRVQRDFPVGFLEPFTIVVTAPEQGAGRVDLNLEVMDGLSSARGHDLQAAAAHLGLDGGEAAGLAGLLASASSALGAQEGAAQPPAEACGPASRIDAAVRAGSALERQRAGGAGDAVALASAARAARTVACNTSEVFEAVAAAAPLLRRRRAGAAAEEA
ncbi:unnamed protein product, partial [Prorocentrum cordatum]